MQEKHFLFTLSYGWRHSICCKVHLLNYILSQPQLNLNSTQKLGSASYMVQYASFGNFNSNFFFFFRQHAASLYGFVRQSVSQSVKKKIQATSKQARRLRFGILTVLTNIRSTKVLHHASCIMHHASCIKHHASCITGRRLRFGMFTDLTNVRSTKVL